MKRKLLIVIIVLTIVLGLLLMAAYAGSTVDMKQKKNASQKHASPKPEVSIGPYQVPLPQWGHHVKIAVRMPLRVK